MKSRYIIGLDFGTISARGVLVDVDSGDHISTYEHVYRHGVLTASLPNGEKLPPNFALQVPDDYIEAAQAILTSLAAGREVAAIGIACTASSPLLTRADGTPLTNSFPAEPHAYVKHWKHGAAQAYAESINLQWADYLREFGGQTSGEWLLAKAAEIQTESGALWALADKIIEAGDWIVWQLTGNEFRSLDIAAYKAHFTPGRGYPTKAVIGLEEKLSHPVKVGTSAGMLAESWCRRTGILGRPHVAVAMIDSHATAAGLGVVDPNCLLGVFGTSAGFLATDSKPREAPAGFEKAAFGAIVPDIWCCEAGQAAFGDMLSWFVRTFPKSNDISENFASYSAAAARLSPGESGILALDWFGGNRVPWSDTLLSGLLLGLNMNSSAEAIYRGLIESLCYGTRSIYELALKESIEINRVIFAGRLTKDRLLCQCMADVMGIPIEVPEVRHPSAIGAGVYGAVASQIVPDLKAGSALFSKGPRQTIEPNDEVRPVYDDLYGQYQRLSTDTTVREVMRSLQKLTLTANARRKA